MTSYISIAVFAYFLFAVNGVVDKFLLSKVVKQPIAYAFYIGITGPLTLLLAPFGLQSLLTPGDFFIAIVGGGSFIFALVFFYKAIRQTSISRILPIEGGFVPFFTLILAYVLLHERLGDTQIFAFALLVSGAVLIAFKKEKTGWHASALGNGIIAAFLFALSFTLTKYTFDQTNFVSGLIWTRLGFFLVSLSFLIPENTRKHILNTPKETSTGSKFLYYGTRITGGVAGLLQNYSIAIGSVTIVNALQGTQYAALLLMTMLLSKYYPRILKEKASPGILVQKILALILIVLGLIFLAKSP
ncbi:MAG: EamA family transporter [bacterium]|nr:EamA family transporter [bacterium]